MRLSAEPTRQGFEGGGAATALPSGGRARLPLGPIIISAALLLLPLLAPAQGIPAPTTAVPTVTHSDQTGRRMTGPAVVERGPHHKVWQRFEIETGPDGKEFRMPRQYTELASGMHYLENGQWKETREEIEIKNGVAVADHGPHKVRFAPNLNSAGAIEVTTPDGKVVRSHVLGLSYDDPVTGKMVVIAEVKDCIGKVVPPNQVIYEDAFDDVKADVRITYTKSGMEQDVILREQIPNTPEDYGLSSASTRLQVLTEFLDAPVVRARSRGSSTVKTGNGRNAHSGAVTQESDDEDISFGSMRMGRGRAFALEEETPKGGSSSPAGLPSLSRREGRNRGASMEATPVRRQMIKAAGRNILVEEVKLSSVHAELEKLPMRGHASVTPVKDSVRHVVSNKPLLPPVKTAKTSSNPMEMASLNMQDTGFVLDYVILDSIPGDMTFQCDTTYLVSSPVTISGNAIFEGGTVIKYDTAVAAVINVLGTVDCQTGPYRPAVFTSATDNSIGENCNAQSQAPCYGSLGWHVVNASGLNLVVNVYDDTWSTVVNGTVAAGGTADFSFRAGLEQYYYIEAYDVDGNVYCWTEVYPAMNSSVTVFSSDGSASYAESGASLCTPAASGTPTALSLANGGEIHDVRISNLGVGLDSASYCSVMDAQFVNCGTALKVENAGFYAGNVLFSRVGTGFGGQTFQGVVEHLTYDQGTSLTTDSGAGGSTLSLNNSILTAVAGDGNVPLTSGIVARPAGAGVYQVAGGGAYYLPASSACRNAGSESINPTLREHLMSKTTHAPIVYSGVTFPDTMTLSPCATRDTDMPDLGYHYDPLDYVFGDCSVNENVTFNPGTAVGWFMESTTHALHIADRKKVVFDGRVDNPACWVRHNTVMECGNGEWPNRYGVGGITGSANQYDEDPTKSAELHMRFTRCSMINPTDNYFRDDWGYLTVRARDCEFTSGGFGGYVLTCSMTNCLFDRTIAGSVYGFPGNEFKFYNCTWRGGWVYSSLSHTVIPVELRECAFDGTVFSFSGPATYSLGNNAFLTTVPQSIWPGTPRPDPLGTGNVTVDAFNWESGLLGRFYLPPDSALIDGGSRKAHAAGLSHYTTQAGQTLETVTPVDIGYHYLAVYANREPLDADRDLIADYLSTTDINANGIADTWELEHFGNLDQPGDGDFDGDGVSNLDEYLPTIDINSNGIPDAWEMQHFGNLDQARDGDYDSDGVSNWAEWQDRTDPNNVSFRTRYASFFVNTTSVDGTILVDAGEPAQMAVLVDAAELTPEAWQPFNATFSAPLGASDGVHTVRVALRGRAATSEASWYENKIVLDRVPPVISMTSPNCDASMTSQPVLQIKGSADEPLTQVEYDIQNTSGTRTGRPGFVVDLNLESTRAADYTRDDFQCFDVPLATGMNTIIVRARDRAGNTAAKTITVDLNPSSDTTAPVIRVDWPKSGMTLSGEKVFIRGKLDDATAKIEARIGSQTYAGLVERDGSFWIQDVPLAPGVNAPTLVASDASGNESSTLLNVTSDGLIELAITQTPSLDGGRGEVLGKVYPRCEVTVNGTTAVVKDILDADGTFHWTAENTPVYGRSMAVFDAAATPELATEPAAYASVALEKPCYLGLVQYDMTSTLESRASGDMRSRNYTKKFGAFYYFDDIDNLWKSWASASVDDISTWSSYHAIWTSHYIWDSSDPQGTVRYNDQDPVPIPESTDIHDDMARLRTTPDRCVAMDPHWSFSIDFVYHYFAADVVHKWDPNTWIPWGVFPGDSRTLSIDAKTKMTLYTGGSIGSTRSHLFCLGAQGAEGAQDACEYGQPMGFNLEWHLTPAYPIDPTTVQIMGKNLNEDRQLWVSLPDNAEFDFEMVAPVKHFYAEASCVKSDIDLDVDSDNKDGIAGSNEEDAIEETAPGKILLVNRGDADLDGIPDFADGFDAFGDPEIINQSDLFTPMTLTLPMDCRGAFADPEKAKIRFRYNESTPDGVTFDEANGYVPAAGFLRVWAKDGNAFRYKARVDQVVRTEGEVKILGDYVAPNVEYLAKYFPSTLYIEGIRPGSCEITVELDPDGKSGYIALDMVAVTVLKVDILARTGKINYGFDPKEKVLDGAFTGAFPWASVGKDDTSDVPKILIDPGTVANQVKLVVVSGSASADVNPKSFSAASTDLTVTGQGTAGNALVEARIESSGLVCERLSIMALPKRTLSVGIYYVKDSFSAGTFPVGGPAASSVIGTLNDVFKQARIEFFLEDSATVDKPYDSNGDGKFQEEEVDALNVTGQEWKGDLKMFFIRNSGVPYSNDPPLNAFYIRGEALFRAPGGIIFTENAGGMAPLGVAHEFGHVLEIPAIESALHDEHDAPPWPEGEESLMRSGIPQSNGAGGYTLPNPGRWLRHEDWINANSAAGEQ
jgi:hypothetical protein